LTAFFYSSSRWKDYSDLSVPFSPNADHIELLAARIPNEQTGQSIRKHWELTADMKEVECGFLGYNSEYEAVCSSHH
jgi:hypothetical protein